MSIISVALTGIALSFSIPTALAAATVYCLLSRNINTKARNKTETHTQVYILTKRFSGKLYHLYT